jgi:hypothetical protein
MPTTVARSRAKARIAGVVYLMVFITGSVALLNRGPAGMAAGLAAGLLYVVVTWLLYDLFKPVSRRLSGLAAAVSFFGIAAGPLHLTRVNPLVFFAIYCLLLGWLIFRSRFAPPALGGLMAFAGLGWLTFLSPALGRFLYPYNLAPGLIGEGALTIWLLLRAEPSGRSTDGAAARIHA